MGHRHAPQHWTHVLSAHVWVQGWLAGYYLTGDHRALDEAIQTAEMHVGKARVTVGSLTQTYDGNPKPVSGRAEDWETGRMASR
jgi:hypothetical protein